MKRACAHSLVMVWAQRYRLPRLQATEPHTSLAKGLTALPMARATYADRTAIRQSVPSAAATVEAPPVVDACAAIGASPVIAVNGPVAISPAVDPGAARRQISKADAGNIGGAVDGCGLRRWLGAHQRRRVGRRRLRRLLRGRLRRHRQQPCACHK